MDNSMRVHISDAAVDCVDWVGEQVSGIQEELVLPVPRPMILVRSRYAY